MPRTSTASPFVATLTAAVLLFPAIAGAQPDVVLYGRVVGSDHASAPPPPTWTVTVTSEFLDRTTGLVRKSQHDIYAYRISTGRTARLVFQAIGYRPHYGEWLTESVDNRVRPDVMLEKYETQMSWLSGAEPEKVQKDLEEQADLARRTGTNDIFLANYAIQRKILSKQPRYAATVEGFEKSNVSYREIMKVSETRQIDPQVIASLVDDDPAIRQKISPAVLYEFATKQDVAPELRALAIDTLTVSPAAPSLTPEMLKSLRSWTASNDWALRVASTGALNKRGTAEDKAATAKDHFINVLKDTSKPDADRVAAAKELEKVKEPAAAAEVQGALKTAAATDPSPDVRKTAAGAAAAKSKAAAGTTRKP